MIKGVNCESLRTSGACRRASRPGAIYGVQTQRASMPCGN